MASKENVIDLTLSDDDRTERRLPSKKPAVGDDEVTIVEPSPLRSSLPPTTGPLNGDLQVLSTRGENWAVFSHTREMCQKHEFSFLRGPGNANFCDKCFCYVCDVPASACRSWGLGRFSTDHCNANSKEAYYFELRRKKRMNEQKPSSAAQHKQQVQEQKQQQQQHRPAAVPTSTSTSTAVRSGNPTHAASTNIRAHPPPQPTVPSTAAAPAPPPPPVSGGTHKHDKHINNNNNNNNRNKNTCTLTRKPDPELDPSLFKLAEVSFDFKFKPTQGFPTLASVIERSVSCGTFEPHHFERNKAMGNMQSLRTLAEGRSHPSHWSPVLEFVPPPCEDPPTHSVSDPNPIVTLINVNFWDGRAPVTTCAVSLPEQPTVKQAMTAVAALLNLSEQEYDLVPCCLNGTDIAGFCHPDKVITGDQLLSFAKALNTTKAILSPPSSSSVPPPPPSPLSASTEYPNEGPATLLSAYVVPKKYTRSARPSNWEGMVGIAAVNWGVETPSGPCRTVYHPPAPSLRLPQVLIPIRVHHMTGGNEAFEAVGKAFLQAVKQFRRRPYDEAQTDRLLGALKIEVGELGRGGRSFKEVQRMDSLLRMFSYGFHSSQRELSSGAARYSPVVLNVRLPDCHHTIAFKDAHDFRQTFAIHPSCTLPALEKTCDFFEKLREHQRIVAENKELTTKIIDEICHSSFEFDPSVALPPSSSLALGSNTHSSIENGNKALCRYKFRIVPGPAHGPASVLRDGTLIVQVYAWHTAGRTNVGFWDSGTHWSSGGDGRGRGSNRHHTRNVTPHRLHKTLTFALRGNPEFAAYDKHHRYWVQKNRELNMSSVGGGVSISMLMEALERPDGPAAEQPPGLSITMRPYQLQSLKFMLDAERGEGGFRRHLWVRVTTASGIPYYFSPVLGRVARDVAAEPWGGFCCEEMGLGKTVEVLALCLANPAPLFPFLRRQHEEQEKALTKGASWQTKQSLLPSRATLVVCAVSLVGQWIAEAREKTNGSLRIHMYHGTNRIRHATSLANDFDLVVTTYATLSADSGLRKNATAATTSPLHKIKWHRLVLDESHTCKNPAVGHTKACVALAADRRWMCTGTPINTDISDLFGQFAVLGMSPFNNRAFFDSNVKAAFSLSARYSGGTCVVELLHMLGATMIRHTKRQQLGGEQVLQLPPKEEEEVGVLLNARERAVYKEVHTQALSYFQRYETAGAHIVSRNLLHIMSLLQPLRRICSGGALLPRDLTLAEPTLTLEAAQHLGDAAGIGGGTTAGLPGGPGSSSNSNTNIPTTLDESLVAPDEECSICMDAFEQPALTTCQHWFCKGCIVGCLQQVNSRCPLCRAPQRVHQLRLGLTHSDARERRAAAVSSATADNTAAEQLAANKEAAEAAAAAAAARDAAASTSGGIVCDSKLKALLRYLRTMRRNDPTAKALVFSQYNSTIEWLKGRLSLEGFGHRHISGSMPLTQRAKAIQAFQGDPPTTVFLLSMRSGAVGINLTAASHVFLLEPCLNPALVEQAVGRAWRMGQRRSVKVVHFYVKGSVEETIMALSNSRHHGAGGSSGDGGVGGDRFGDRHLPKTNMRVEDHAGSIKQDKQLLRLNELQKLFKEPIFPSLELYPPPGDSDNIDDEDEDEGKEAGEDVALPAMELQQTKKPASMSMRRSKAGRNAFKNGVKVHVVDEDAYTPLNERLHGGQHQHRREGKQEEEEEEFTPRVTLAVPTVRHGNRKRARIAIEGDDGVEVEEEESLPADAFERMKKEIGREGIHGRLTPADGGAVGRNAVFWGAAGVPMKRKRGRPPKLSRLGDAGEAAVAAHHPRPTPETDITVVRSVGGRSLRTQRRRVDYAALLNGGMESEEEKEEGTTHTAMEVGVGAGEKVEEEEEEEEYTIEEDIDAHVEEEEYEED